jgi:CIC family chloride channel protein
MSEAESSESKRFKNLDWTMARTVMLSIIIGGMASFAAKGLLLAIKFTENFFHTVPLSTLVQEQGIGEAGLTFIEVGIMSAFGLLVGLMTHYLIPGRANRGLSHVIEDVHFNRGQTNVKEGLSVGLISAVSIGAGASVGRYGPAVHLGAAAASGVGTFLSSLIRKN